MTNPSPQQLLNEKFPAWRQWYQAARPHTWHNAFAPVIAGLGAAAADGYVRPGRALLAALVAWALVVGVNYANDYSDGIRGTDGETRTGPTRLVGGGHAPAHQVRLAAFGFFGLAGLAGLWLAMITQPWLVLIGLICIAGAWFYTGGKNPYGYRGFGEVAVFVFFGLVAVLGTQYTQAGFITPTGVLLAIAVGAISASINLVNNIRDIPSDKEAGKITLAVRLGDEGSRRLWTILNAGAYACILIAAAWHVGVLAGLAALPFTIAAAQPVRRGARGPQLIPVLGQTGEALLVFAVATALGLVLL